MQYDDAQLPAYAYAYSPYTGGIVRIVRGECAMFGVNNQTCVDELNAAAGVTRAQAAAMYNGAMRGWSTPYAIPANYNDAFVGICPPLGEYPRPLSKRPRPVQRRNTPDKPSRLWGGV